MAAGQPRGRLFHGLSRPGLIDTDDGLGVLVGFIDADHAIAASGLGEAVRYRLLLDDLVHSFGSEAAPPLAYVEQDGTRETWSRGWVTVACRSVAIR